MLRRLIDALKEKTARLVEFSRTRRARIAGIVLLLFFVVFTITGFFVIPPYVKKIAAEKLSEQIGRQVNLGGVLINPYALSITFKNVEIKEADGKTNFVSFDRLYLNLEVMSMFRGGPVLNEIKLDRPYFSIVRTGSNTYNFSDIVERLSAKNDVPAEGTPSKTMRFSVSHIQIADGRVEFDDRPAYTRHTISQINLVVPFISNLSSYSEAPVEPSFSATVNGTPVNFKGGSKVFSDSRETSFDIVFRDIDIPYYLGYAPARLNVRVPSGRLDIDMKFAYRQFKDRKPLLSLTGELKLKDFTARLKTSREDFIKVPTASLRDLSYDMEANRLDIAAISSEKGFVWIDRASDGQINLGAVVQKGQPQLKKAVPKRQAGPDEDQLKLLVKSVVVSGYSARFSDHSLRESAVLNMDSISFIGQNLSTEKNIKGTVKAELMFEKKGIFEINGSVSLTPAVAELAINARAIPLKPFNPYVAETAQAVIAAGALSINGNLLVSMPAGADPKTSFMGKIQVSKFSMLDKANSEDLLKWDNLYIGETDARYAPLYLHIKEVALSNFYSRLIVNADRTTNIQQVFGQTKKNGQAEASKEKQKDDMQKDEPRTARNIKIDKITLQGGRINFTDNFIKPRFSANLLEVGGRITGLTSDENRTGDVELRGMYERYAPLEITGKINPLREDRYIELKAVFRDMDLAALTPYSGRYAGYTIEKGKLSFQLDYMIVRNKLDAKNSIFLDQLTFGEKVESPDATRLPVKLGVALLKDRKGQISLDIPVSGQVDDPEFSIGSIVLKVIVNLLVKAATSPFALLGAVFGGGEQLSYAEFDAGSANITAESQKKLDTIVKALSERPGLKIDIIGHADPEKDREGLKQYLMLRKVKVQKQKELAKDEKETPSLDSITVAPEEYPEYLKRAYREEKFPKPRNILGMAKSLPVAEMEKLMLTNMAVAEDDLRLLARDRAMVVKDYLLKSKLVEKERIFLVDSQTLAPEKKEGAKASRVDFRLK